MKPVLLSLCFLAALNCLGQHPLEKTLWKIRSLNQNGAIVLQQIRYTERPDPKKDYLAFDDKNRVASNIISIPGCQQAESGSYTVSGATMLHLTGTDAAVNKECKNFYSMSGRYKFSLNEDLLVLRAVPEEDTDEATDWDSEEEDEAIDVAEEDDDPENETDEEADTEATAAPATPAKAVAEPAPASYEMGFGQVTADIITGAEATVLQQSIQAIYRICNTEIAIQNIGNNTFEDYSDAYLKTYASHIIWENEARIRNNIVILFDETKARSWIFTGTHNGKFITAAEVDQWKSMLDDHIRQGKIAEGLHQVLGRIEQVSRAQCTKMQGGTGRQ